MAYEAEEIRTSQEIFYYLLEHHELREEDEQLLYKAYTEEESIRNLVKSQGEIAGSNVERYGNVIYLIPKEENNFLGFSKQQLKGTLCKSGATDKDYYLSQFVILTLLVEFFDGQGSSSKSREYMRVGELMNCLSARLKEGAAEETASEEEEDGKNPKDMHKAIVHNFKKYHLFGFTGTPIFAVNAGSSTDPRYFTTAQTFGDQLHTYTIVDAINDKNVLPFRVDYIKTMDAEPDMDDKQVWDIDREKAFMAPKRISLVTKYILDHFDQKTYRGDKSYEFNLLTNVAEVASAQRGAVEEIKQKQRVSGFNSIFCVASVPMAKLYYQEFKKQMSADPTKKLR